MSDTATPERGWQVPLSVPAMPHGEIESDGEFLQQAAEYIVAMVRLSMIEDGTIESQDVGRAPVEDHVLKTLKTIYQMTRKAYENKD